MKLFRIVYAIIIGLSLGGAAAPADQDKADQDKVERPNFLILLADDLGFSDIGCYGGEIHTPNLDELASRGLRYTQFYNTARCWPTRAALLTGFYAQQVRRDALADGEKGGQGTRPEWAKLLPHRLKQVGYRTYHSGKWHVDGSPTEVGFDHSYSLEDHDRHFGPRLHREDDHSLPAVDSTHVSYYSATAIADHAIRCLKQHAQSTPHQPFFQYVAFTTPHFPLQAPPEDVARYRDQYGVGWDNIRAARWHRIHNMLHLPGELAPLERDLGPPYDFPNDLAKLGPGEMNRELPWAELNDEQRAFQATKMAVHAAMVDRMDQEIGRIMAQLRANRTLDNTVVMFLSDNGASAEIMVRGDGHNPHVRAGGPGSFLCLGPGWSRAANTPFRRHKTWVHEGGIASPLIVHWPAGIKGQGELRTAVSHVIDIQPTLLHLAGRDDLTENLPEAPPGVDISRTFPSEASLTRPPLWWLHEGNRAYREGDWKVVAVKGQPWELYNLRADRTELVNLADDDPTRTASMAQKWQKMTDAIQRLRDAPKVTESR